MLFHGICSLKGAFSNHSARRRASHAARQEIGCVRTNHALLPGAGRLAPPSELSPVEARIWQDVLDALPGHFVGPGGDSQVLRRVAAEGALAEDMERRLRELLTAGTPEAQKELAALTVTHTALSKSLAFLLGALRRPRRAG